jgi:hypothetical protein
VAHTSSPRLPQRIGGGGGFVTNRLNETRGQTLSFVVVHSSHQAQPTPDGPPSSPPSPGSPQHSAPQANTTPNPPSKRLNPYFGERLMGWPTGWTSATAPSASSALGTELFRSRLAWHLSCLLDGQDL